MIIDIDLFWTNILTSLAKSEPLSYLELKGLNVEEFFLILTNYDRKNG